MKFFKAKVSFQVNTSVIDREYVTHSESKEDAYVKIYEQMNKEFDITKLTIGQPYETEEDRKIVGTRRYIA